MKIRQIQYYLMVAETGSFTRSADELHISQSSLSKQIQSLEAELGYGLFDRSRRQIDLTRAGRAFLDHARALHAAYLHMMDEMGAYRTTPSLSILSIPVITQYGITGLLTRFRRAYPQLEVTLEEREPAPIFRSLANHTHDLAFVRSNYLDPTVYDSLIIAQDRLLVAVSEHHRLAKQRSVSLSELVGENFIIYDKSTLIDALVLDACHRAGFDPRIIYTTLRIESILGQVASNNGIALVMARLFNHSRHHGVAGVALDEPITSNVVLAWLRGKHLSQAGQAFIDFVGRS